MLTSRSLRPVAGRALTQLTRPARAALFRRELAEQRPIVRINVGAGRTRLPGWIDTDVTFRSRNHLDLTKPWPVEPGSVDYVYADNVIEHFPLSLVPSVLRHVRTALRPRGVLRLVTPDVGRTARAYLDDPGLTAAHLLRHERAGYDVTYPVDLLRVIFTESGHHAGYLFDEQSLRSELEAAGFAVVRRCESGESEHADLQGLEQRSDTTSSLLSLVMEAEPEGRRVSAGE